MKAFCLVLFLSFFHLFAFSQGEILWTTKLSTYTSNADIGDKDLIVDAFGNAYFTATYYGSIIIPGGGTVCSSGSSYNVVIGKVNTNGQLIWARQLTGTSNEYAYSITLDASQNCYITGSFAGSLAFEGTTLAAGTGSQKMYVLKLDSAGTYLANFTPGYVSGSSKALDIEVDDQQNCYVVGSFRNTYNAKLQIGIDTLQNTLGVSYEECGLIFKLNSSFQPVWHKHFQSRFHDGTFNTGAAYTQISKAPDNNYYLAGNFKYEAHFPDTTLYNVSGDTQFQDALIEKIDTAGVTLWRKHYGIVNSADEDAITDIMTMETDKDGNVLLGGTFEFYDAGANLVIENYSFQNGWACDIYYSKYDRFGNLLWARHVNGPNNNDYPYDLAINQHNNVLFSANLSEHSTFTDTTFVNLDTYHGYSFRVGGNNGEFQNLAPTFPFTSGVIQGRFPEIAFDSFGNRYSFGMSLNTVNGNPDGLFISKRSSGEIMLSGQVFEDVNLNTVQDSTENPVVNVVLKGDDGMFYKTSDQDGNFTASLDTNNHTLQVYPPQYWYVFNPSSGVRYTTSPYVNDSITGLNFALAMYPDITDVRIDVSSQPFRPGFHSDVYITCKNVGTTISNTGQVKLIFSDTLNYFSSTVTPTLQIGDTLIWTYDSLDVAEELLIIVDFAVPADVSLLGHPVSCYVDINPALPDTNTFDNFDTLVRVIGGSYDPNYKSVSPAGIGFNGSIPASTDWLEYEIHFQNTGTDTAINIRLVDTLSPKLIIQTLDVLNASHFYHYTLDGPGVLTFSFDSIMLPDSTTNLRGSEGFVKYRVKCMSALPQGTTIRNRADIFFDFNPPVLTNISLNTIHDCSGSDLNTSSAYLCQGDSVLFSGTYLSSAGTYYDSLQSVYGCDSIRAVTIIVIPTETIFDQHFEICEGDSILLYQNFVSVDGTYYSTQTNSYGCEDVHYSTVSVESCLGLDQLHSQDLQIFPNPGTGIYHIEAENLTGKMSCIEIYNTSFQLLKQENIVLEKMQTIDLSAFAPGIYFIRISDAQNRRTGRLVKI